MQGDYPMIKGDQELFFIFNDLRQSHTETDGRKLGIEIHGMAYAFDSPEDSVLWNSVFLHYDIINRSDTAYHDVLLGAYTDISVGMDWDDYVGCDVKSGMYFGYNSDDYDEDGTPQGDYVNGYHDHPPAMGVQILGGPTMDTDGIDNPSGGCDYSINGLNFGDSIPDNERLGMTRFVAINNSAGVLGDPFYALQYYNYLKGIWKDNNPILYGGTGHISGGAVGPECLFMYPGDSDSCNWGTNGIPPNGGFNQNDYYWDETTVGNWPSDRRGLGCSGPFTFLPGQVQQLDLAFVFARDFNGTALNSVELLRERCKLLKEKYQTDPDFFSSIHQIQTTDLPVIIFPNPSKDKISVTGLPAKTIINYEVYDITGSEKISGSLDSDETPTLSVQDLQNGIYIIKFTANDFCKTAKLVKK
jgi:hypothetical protein